MPGASIEEVRREYDSFSTLELPRQATETDVKTAYRRLALLNHPDKVGAAGEDTMKKINAAYEYIIEKKLCSLAPTNIGMQQQAPAEPRPARRPSSLTEESHFRRNFWFIRSQLTWYITVRTVYPLRDPSSRTREDQQQLYKFLGDLKVLGDQHSSRDEACHMIGTILNLAKRIRVLDEKVYFEARWLDQHLTLEKVMAQVKLTFEAEALSMDFVRDGWAEAEAGWSLDEVWSAARAERETGKREENE
ncbi:hypothetical protein PMZ80_006188 [Knufia obscura]|uniref:J domain-containing protein n=2 Tax=Knufia TaxID=430999 RepID=A0AAN8EG75_9EURO|nr:hypothetical protein PMZ80_006188 [Knufia obscura]KAK5954858.1 hypothetical protein OHC33_004584 [Knufia fluminis]